jgi:hypothetical protein
MSLVSINDVLKITTRVEKIHPYKVVGDRDSYSPYNEGWSDCVSLIEHYLEQLPSAEPERKWIPFEVALPNDRQKVLCVNKHDEMMVGGYMSDYGMTFPCYFEKPIAWMPLPEPWRGDR